MDVRIYRTETDYLDASQMMAQGGLPRCTVVENRPGSATMTLVNDYQRAGHNLVSDCALWQSGVTEPLRCGMYVSIHDNNELFFEGWITTITSRSEVVDIEIGDGKTFLGKQGTWIRRNFYGETARFYWLNTAMDGDTPYIDLTGVEGIVDTNQVYWSQVNSYDIKISDGTDVLRPSEGITLKFDTIARGYLRKVMIRCGNTQSSEQSDTITMSVYSGNDLKASRSYSAVFERYGTREIAMEFSEPLANTDVHIEIKGTNSRIVTRSLAASDSPYQVVTSSETIRGHIAGVFEFSTIDQSPTPVASTSTSARIYPATISPSMKAEPYSKRARVFVSSGDLPVADVMQNVAEALGRRFEKRGTFAPSVGIARIGGGYALDYLQAMASVSDEAGHSHTFTTEGADMTLVVGDCHTMSDAPAATLVWGGSYTGEGIAFASFNPSMTMKNRPSLVTVRATASPSSDSHPILTTVEDVTASDTRGMIVETVAGSTSVASDKDAVREAYGTLSSNQLDSWEGTMTLPGILSGFTATSGAHTGSGIVVSITDPRNGIEGYKARVRQVQHDWNTMTTSLTLGNLDSATVNRISDTIAMAHTGNAEAFSAASSASGFDTQYLRMRMSGVSVGTANTVRISVSRASTTATVDLGDVSVGVLPNGTKVLQARAISTILDTKRYGVTAITVNGVTSSIPEAIRPDFINGQTLIVSLTLV